MLHYEALSNHTACVQVVPALFRVHKALGPGLLEACYEEAMTVELSHLNIPFTRQQEFPVFYRYKKIGSYFADLVINNQIILDGPSHGSNLFPG